MNGVQRIQTSAFFDDRKCKNLNMFLKDLRETTMEANSITDDTKMCYSIHTKIYISIARESYTENRNSYKE